MLLQIYTRNLGHNFPDCSFKISYADDSYVAITCEESEIDDKLNQLSKVASNHIECLESIGMTCNRSKTEFIIFDRWSRFGDRSLAIGSDMISPSESMRILGIIFQNNLRWTKHVNKSISSANLIFLPIKYIGKFLTKNQLRTAINAHFVSKLTFASTVWNKVITAKERKNYQSI